jgi:hypothetical protein
MRALMDCHGEMPRFAFGHLLDEDGCQEDDALTVDVMAAASGDKLCTVTLAEQEPVHHLKTRIAETLNLPESDQILLLPNGERLGATRRLRSVLPSAGRSASVTLVVSRPACRCCGVRDGLWGRRANLIQCAHCLEAYYCSRECMIADWERHARSGF